MGRKNKNRRCLHRNKVRTANGEWDFTGMPIQSLLGPLTHVMCQEYPYPSIHQAAMHEMSRQDHKVSPSIIRSLHDDLYVLSHIHLLHSTDLGLAQLTDTPRAHGDRPAGSTTQRKLHTTSPPPLRVTFLMHPAQPGRGSEFPGVASPVTSPVQRCNKPSTSWYVLTLSFYLKTETS